MTPKGTFVVDLAEWVGKGAWTRATDAARRGATDLAVAELLGAKRRQVLAGRGADGRPLPRRRHARPDGAAGPPLAPHRDESRSVVRLRHSKVGSGRVVIWWGDGWGRILGYHARGLVRHAPVRNIIDFTPDALSRIRKKVRDWWGANGEEAVRVGPVAPKPPAPKPPPPPKMPVSSGSPILPGRPIAERLAAWEDGDRLVELVKEAARPANELRARRKAINEEMAKLLMEQAESVSRGMTPAGEVIPEIVQRVTVLQAKIDKLDRKFKEVVEAIGEEDRATRKRVGDILKTDQRARVDILQDVANAPILGSGVGRLSDRTYSTAEVARTFVDKILRRGDVEGLPIQVAQIAPDREQRAHYHPGDRYVALTEGGSVSTAIHEIGHAIEEQLTTGGVKILGRSLEFLAHRVGSEPPQKLKFLFPGSGYDDTESGRKDRFDELFDEQKAYYTGKDYGRDATEILSMGVQKLYDDPVGFAEKDPEYFKFVVGILRGDLR